MVGKNRKQQIYQRISAFRQAAADSARARKVNATAPKCINLDPVYYRKRYLDLRSLTGWQLRRHWKYSGYHEGRFASEEDANDRGRGTSHNGEPDPNAGSAQADGVPIPTPTSSVDGLEVGFYLARYPDVAARGISSQGQVERHYRTSGHREGRLPSLAAWANHHGIPQEVLPCSFTLAAVLRRAIDVGMIVHPEDVAVVMTGHKVLPLPLSDNPASTRDIYLGLAEDQLQRGNKPNAHNLLDVALAFGQSGRLLEMCGNACVDDGCHQLALQYYDAALQLEGASKWVFVNSARCLMALGRKEGAMRALEKGIRAEPGFAKQHRFFDEVADELWVDVKKEVLAEIAVNNSRERVLGRARQFAFDLYSTYYAAFGRSEAALTSDQPGTDCGLPGLPPLKRLNADRILLVGDQFLPQCKRYRIDQKLEQLKLAGKRVDVLDWTELQDSWNILTWFDVVIFYRVPATPAVIKAMAQVNATGKLSIYEIDDLVFDPLYPPPIETYGGYVELPAYRDLVLGMALFNAAASLCRVGLASTEPLRDRLAELVQAQTCLLHRNGLDRLNRFGGSGKLAKGTIDIFYGSGTKAHNSDFVELALPAIARVLKEHRQARLVVVGFVRLPQDFHARFARQITLIEQVQDLEGYWALLEQADINLAVLHDDAINACKSELKWFEAACFGIPSIVSDTVNYRQVTRDGEDVLLATTSDDWYAALKKLISNKDERETMGLEAMRRVRECYNPKRLGETLAAQISEVANRNTGAVRKKIALVNTYFPPQSIGGATRVVSDNFSVLRECYADAFEVCVFTSNAAHVPPHQMTVYEHAGATVYQTSVQWRVNMDWHPKDAEMYRLFKEFLQLERPDVIHFHCIQRLTSSVVEAARDCGVPYVVTVHDAWWISDFQFLVDDMGKVYPYGHPDPYEPVRLPDEISIGQSVRRRSELKALLQDAAQVLTVSEAFADLYQQNGVPGIRVIPNGISTQLQWRPKATSQTKNLVCGHVGGMSKHKGYQLLREAVLEAQPDKLEFLVVDHAREPDYRVTKHWGKVPVTVIGRVPQDGVVDLYRRLDVLFAPSLWPESFGLVTREAAACNCWVVASSLGGIGEGVRQGQTGHVVEPTMDALVSILNRINRDVAHYKKPAPVQEIATAVTQAERLAEVYEHILDDDVVLVGADASERGSQREHSEQ